MPTNIYLDSADWSYLQEGRAPAAHKLLRTAAINGTVALFVSWEHCIEISGLQSGKESRLEFIANFPNVYLFQKPAQQIFKTEAQCISSLADSVIPPDITLEAKLLCQLGKNTLNNLVDQYGLPSRQLNIMSSKVQNRGRKANPARSHKELIMQHRIIGKIFRGEFEDLVPTTDDKRLLARLSNYIIRRGMHTVGKIAKDFRDRGWISFSDAPYDPVFNEAVAVHFPQERRVSQPFMQGIHRWWSHPENRKIAPSLACHYELARSNDGQRQMTLAPSTEIDNLHAAYAPYMDIFTCDKRNASILESILKKLSVHTRVFRTNNLQSLIQGLC